MDNFVLKSLNRAESALNKLKIFRSASLKDHDDPPISLPVFRGNVGRRACSTHPALILFFQDYREYLPRFQRLFCYLSYFAISLSLFLSTMMYYHRHSVSDFTRDWPEVWGSCLNPPLQYWWKTMRNPQRVEPCNRLIYKASKRGMAARARGIQILQGLEFPPPLDGCRMASGGHNGSFHPSSWEGTNGWGWMLHGGPPVDKSCKLVWVTYSTECSPNLNRIADICDMVGIELFVIGLKEWWMGWGGRTRMIRETILSLPADRVVFSSDADDVILLPTKSCAPVNLFRTFASLGRPIVIGAERFCYPDGWRWREYLEPPGNSPFRYLNAGAYLGYAWALLDVIGEVYRGDCTDDQRELTRVYLDDVSYVGSPNLTSFRQIVYSREQGLPPAHGRHPYIFLDHWNAILSSLGGSEFSEFEVSSGLDGMVRNKLTEGRPCFLHQNGDKKERRGNPVVWPKLLKAVGIDELRRTKGYLNDDYLMG